MNVNREFELKKKIGLKFMLQVFMDQNREGLVSQVIFRIGKINELESLISKFDFSNTNINLSEIHTEGINYYKVIFNQLEFSKNLDIMKDLIENLFRTVIKIQLINGFEPYDLVLTIPQNETTQDLSSFLHIICPSVLITEIGKFYNIRHFDITIFFSIVLSIIEKE